MPVAPTYTNVANVHTMVSVLGSVTSLTSAAIAAFIGFAQSEVDAALANRYEVPFTVVPPIVETLTTDIAAYRILIRLFTAQRGNESPWPGRFKEARAMLTDISKGKLAVVLPDGTVLVGRNDLGEVWSSTTEFQPTYHEGPIGTHFTDPAKTAELLNDRGYGDYGERGY